MLGRNIFGEFFEGSFKERRFLFEKLGEGAEGQGAASGSDDDLEIVVEPEPVVSALKERKKDLEKGTKISVEQLRTKLSLAELKKEIEGGSDRGNVEVYEFLGRLQLDKLKTLTQPVPGNFEDLSGFFQAEILNFWGGNVFADENDLAFKIFKNTFDFVKEDNVKPDSVRNIVAALIANSMAMSLQSKFDAEHKEFFDQHKDKLKGVTFSVKISGDEPILTVNYSKDAKEAFEKYKANKEEESQTPKDVKDKLEGLKNHSAKGLILMFAAKPGEKPEDTLKRVASGGSILGGILASFLGIEGFGGLYEKVKGVVSNVAPGAAKLFETAETFRDKSMDKVNEVTGKGEEEVAEGVEKVEGKFFDELASKRRFAVDKAVVLASGLAVSGERIKVDLSSVKDGEKLKGLKGVRHIVAGEERSGNGDLEFGKEDKVVTFLEPLPEGTVVPAGAVFSLVKEDSEA